MRYDTSSTLIEGWIKERGFNGAYQCILNMHNVGTIPASETARLMGNLNIHWRVAHPDSRVLHPFSFEELIK